MGLKSDGSIVAWGYDAYGQCNVPAPNAGFIAIAAGERHSLALKSNGSIVAWGYNPYGQCNVPTPNSGFVAIGAGTQHSLGLQGAGGSLRVNIEPTAAVAYGAQWSVDYRAAWRDSGTTVALPAGDYTILFKDAPNWDTPRPQWVTLLNNQTLITTGTYVFHPGTTGTLVVTIEPAAAVSAGARWTEGLWWHDSGTPVVLPVGTRIVQFNTIASRLTPPDQRVTINDGQTTRIAVYYNVPPTVTLVGIDPPQPGTLDTIRAIATVTDPDGQEMSAYQYEWLRDSAVVTTAPTLDPQHTTRGQQWQVRVRAQDIMGEWSNWGTAWFTIVNTPPTRPIVEIRPRVPNPGSDLILYILEYSTDPDGDSVGYDFEWFMSRDNGKTWLHKAELDGSPQVSNLFIGERELWQVHCIPYEKTSAAPPGSAKVDGKLLGPDPLKWELQAPALLRVEGQYGWDQVYVGQNNPPQMQFTELTGVRELSGKVRLTIQWTWSDADSDACTVQLYWTDRGGHGLNAISGMVPAGSLAYVMPVSIPKGAPVYIHAIIKDAKGAVTKVTSAAITITELAAANPAWLRAE
ncbi:hypothetical protein FJY63_07685 [Candidatus Sumerlaeota bacterium]|nr:hypothetical protein [Candidatus Sumerlaeota bacterium]